MEPSQAIGIVALTFVFGIGIILLLIEYNKSSKPSKPNLLPPKETSKTVVHSEKSSPKISDRDKAYFPSGTMNNGVETGKFGEVSYRIFHSNHSGKTIEGKTGNTWQLGKPFGNMMISNPAIACLITEEAISIHKGDNYFAIPGLPFEDDIVIWPHDKHSFIQTIKHIGRSSAIEAKGFAETLLFYHLVLGHENKSNPHLSEIFTVLMKNSDNKTANAQSSKYKKSELTNLDGVTYEDVVVIDTETTSLKEAHVIEITIINWNGDILYSSLVNTNEEINDSAFNVHKISKKKLID